VGLAGAGTLIGAGRMLAQGEAKPAEPKPAAPVKVATRPFGKTGVKVSMLSLGGIFDITSNHLVLQKALDWGVTYWDTADCYAGGKSEIGIGQFFEKNPDARKKVFLVTKSDKFTPDGMTELLNRSLERMKTDHIDLYFQHMSNDPKNWGNDVKAWAENAKKENKIRFFGFSTHSNMEMCMTEAAKLGWIDGVMVTYNYRVMHTDQMKAALDACTKAGIGVTAMKTQGKRPKSEDGDSAKLLDHFVQRGFSAEQAKLKAVWDNQQIAAICSAMYSVSVLSANVAAATDKVELTAQDKAVLAAEARATCTGYCAGCTALCEAAIGQQVPIGDVLRGLMYARGYGDRDHAREVFARLPADTQQRLAALDYRAAERVCPHGVPIGQLMREAGELLA
jgi:predicted aldo/keto reductase-like oxidoreductase